jgi:hypothetical protein
MAAYADLLNYAAEIKMRAEIRAGEMLQKMAERGERHDGNGRSSNERLRPME